MDEIEDPGDLERKIDQASRIASRVNDRTTYQRLAAWVDELRRRLQKGPCCQAGSGKNQNTRPRAMGAARSSSWEG
jgi:hypothetical protein